MPYLRLPQVPGGEAYLVGTRCQNCGETYLGCQLVCLRCHTAGQMGEVALSRSGELFSYTVVHQSAPWVPVPYIAAVIKLPEGPFVGATLTGCKPEPEQVKVGMTVEMVTEKVRQDKEGNDVIAYRFKPAS